MGFWQILIQTQQKRRKKLGWRQGWSWCLKSACSLYLWFSLDLRIHVNHTSDTEWMLPKFFFFFFTRAATLVVKNTKYNNNIISIYKKTHSHVFLVEKRYANKEDSVQDFSGLLFFCSLALSVTEFLTPSCGSSLKATSLLWFPEHFVVLFCLWMCIIRTQTRALIL